MKFISSLVFSLFVVSSFSQAVFQSNGGNWNSSASWSIQSGSDLDGIPDSDDEVIISGSTINLTSNSSCNLLEISTNGILNFNTSNRNLTVNSDCTFSANGTTSGNDNTRVLTIFGNLLIDLNATAILSGIQLNVSQNCLVEGSITINSNSGVKTIMGILNIQSTGSWISTSITSSTNLIFENGIVNEGICNVASISFSANNQSINGSSTYSISGVISINGITLTNNSQVNHTNTNSNSITGTGNWLQGNNSELNTSASTINIASIDASTNSNVINYNGNNSQSIYQSSYYNLTISVANTKTLIGNTTILNDLTVEAATLSSDAFTLNVSGNTLVTSNGNLNTNSISGTFNLNQLTLTSGRMVGSANGQISCNNFTVISTGNTIGLCTFSNNGTSSITGSLTFSSNTGIKTFGGLVTISPSGLWTSSSITSPANLTFQNGIVNNGSSFLASGLTCNTNNQIFSGNTNYTISGIITIDLIQLTNDGTITQTSTSSNAITGSGSLRQGTNSILNTTASSLNVSGFDASSNPNLVNYNRNNTQTIYNTNYHNLNLTVANNKTLSGPIIINNNLFINAATLVTSTFNLTVNGNTTISSNGNINVSNAATIVDLQDVVLNSSRIVGTANGTINVVSLTTNGSPNSIGIGNFTVSSTTTINGVTSFTSNTGVKRFMSVIQITPTGSWTSTSISVNSNLLVENGIENNGSSFSGGAIRFTSNNQEINGSTSYSFNGIIAVVDVSFTNNSLINQTSTSASGITGTGAWIQGVNSTLNTSVSSINISSFNATTSQNLVNYRRNGSQTIFSTAYYNLNATISGNKTLGGNTSVLNNLTVNACSLLTSNRTLTINGITTIENAGVINTSNTSGLVNAQQLMLNSGSLAGSANGIVNATSLSISGLSNIIGQGRINISTTTNISGQVTFNHPTGNKALNGIVTITPTGMMVNSGGIIIGGSNSWINQGIIRSNSGSISIGTSLNNNLQNLSASLLEIMGGSVTIAGSFENTGGTYIQSGGTLLLTTIGNTNSSIANFHFNGSSSLSINSGDIIIRRPNSNAIPFNAIEIQNGSGSKSISGGTIQIGDAFTSSSQIFNLNSAIPLFNLTINSTNTPTIRLVTNDLTIDGTLTLNGGNIDGATNNKTTIITNGNPNAISRTNGFINYSLQRSINTTLTSYLFPVGSSSNYLPMTLNFSDLTSGNLIIRAINSDELNLVTSIIDASKSVNCHWVLSASGGFTTTDYSGTMDYTTGLNDEIASVGSYVVGKHNSGWTYPTVSVIGTANSISFSSANGIGNFAVGALKLTEIIAEQCGVVLTDNNTDIYCNSVSNTTIYEFKLVNGGTTLTIQKPSRTFKINQVSGIIPGVTYQVSVRTFTNGSWTSFGPECPITTSSALATIDPSQCGTTLTNNDVDIACLFVPSTTIYEFRLVNGGTTLTIQKPTNTFKFSQVNGVLPGVTYLVSVRTFTNGAWTGFGSSCNITSSNIVLTNLIPSQCGIVLSDITTDLYANAVVGATLYRFRVHNSAGTVTIDKVSRTFKLTQLSNVKYNEINTIDVDAFVNGSWIGFGTTCNVTTPPLTSTKLINSQCGITLSTITTYLYANTIYGASQYKFRISNVGLAYNQEITKTNSFFRMSELTGLAINTSYNVEVDYFINGAWQGYGAVCTITTPPILAIPLNDDLTQLQDQLKMETSETPGLNAVVEQSNTNDVILVEAFPNPFQGEFKLVINNSDTEEFEITVLDALGKLVEIRNSKQVKENPYFGIDYSKGIYFISFINGEKGIINRVIKE